MYSGQINQNAPDGLLGCAAGLFHLGCLLMLLPVVLVPLYFAWTLFIAK